MDDRGSKPPKLKFETRVYWAAILVMTAPILVLTLVVSVLVATNEWKWRNGPILDARFNVGPLDPKPIEGACPTTFNYKKMWSLSGTD